VTYLIIKVSKL